MVRSPRPSTRQLVLCLFALLMSHPASAGTNRWSSSGPGGGYVTALHLTAGDTPRLLAATPLTPLYRSSEAGGWVRSSDGLPNLEMKSIAGPTSPSSTRYVSTSGSLHRSTDGGVSWRAISSPSPGNELTLSSGPSALYARGSAYLYRSTDQGDSWTQVFVSLDLGGFLADPSSQRVFGFMSGSSVVRSTDGGDTWQATSICCSNRFGGLLVSPSSPDILYLFGAYGGDSSPSLWRSSDGGATWTRTSAPAAPNAAVIHATDPALVFLGSGGSVYGSTDSGATWADRSNGLPGARITVLRTNPAHPEHLYAATAGAGIFRSTDSGGSWQAQNTGLHETAPSSVRIGGTTLLAPTNIGPSHTLLRSTDSGGSWSDTPESGSWGFQAHPAFDPRDSSVAYVGGPNLHRTTDGGATWLELPPCPGGGDLAVDTKKAGRLHLAANGYLYRSEDDGRDWAVASDIGYAASLALAPSTPQRIYYVDEAPAAGPPLVASFDDGVTWVRLGNGLPGVGVGRTGLSRLGIAPSNPEVLYYSNGLTFHRSSDGGATWRDLGELFEPRAIVVDPSYPDRVYVATPSGVRLSLDGGATFSALNDGLEDLNVLDLSVSVDGRLLAAATAYHGVYTYTIAPKPSSYYTLTPCRAVDTRLPDGPYGGPALASAFERAFALKGVCGLPATATSVSANLTLTQAGAAGHLVGAAAGRPFPPTSLLNVSAGGTRAGMAILELPDDGSGVVRFEPFLDGGGAATHLVVDVNGYFAPAP